MTRAPRLLLLLALFLPLLAGGPGPASAAPVNAQNAIPLDRPLRFERFSLIDGLSQNSVLSILQMPAGVPVGTLAVGKAGAENAALLAAAILANDHPTIAAALAADRAGRTQAVLANPDPSKARA